MVVPSKPRRRSYRTGASLPALTDEYRPIPLGRDENGEPDGQIRALGVLIRNRADSPIYVKEGPEAIDEMEIARGEDYRIWEPNGVNAVKLKGENGGETAEIRTLEAHNDFDLTDRIEAFARSLAHFVGTATRDTRITGQDVDISIDDAGGISVTGSVDANISGTDVDIPVTGDVAISDITGQSTDLDIAGNVTVDDINATSANFDGDITGQTDFDFQVIDRRGKTFRRTMREQSVGVDWPTWTPHTWTLYNPASATYVLQSYTYMDTGESSGDTGFSVRIDRGTTGSWHWLNPSRMVTTANAKQYADANDPLVTVGAFESGERMSYTVTFPDGVKIEPGDSVQFAIRNGENASGTTLGTVWLEAILTEIERVNP